MGKLKLFCEISPLTYQISVKKNIFLRKIKDALSRQRFARIKSYEKLPVMIYKHASLIRIQTWSCKKIKRSIWLFPHPK